MGDNALSQRYREKLSSDLNHLKDSLTKTIHLYDQSVKTHNDSMQRFLNNNQVFDESYITRVHRHVKSWALDQVCQLGTPNIHGNCFFLLI